MESSSCISLEPAVEIKVVRKHWLTRKPDSQSYLVASLSVLTLMIASFVYWADLFNSQSWMTAIPQSVFSHEYWRLWTALFAHSDLAHLLSNSLLFSAFAYLLFGHFGSLVYPFAAFLFGGLTNLIVLFTLPADAELLGASGMVYWMGAAWLTLYLYLESRDRFSKRALKAIGVAAMLFVPESFQPHVSYLSHFVGFILGVIWAMAYYYWNRKKFVDAEEVVSIVD
jgi:rhomboid protease GluP